MTRETYINKRTNNSFSINDFYDYYCKKAEGKVYSFIEFNMPFQLYFGNNSQAVLETLDREYDVFILKDKQGKIIKIY